LNRAGIRIRNSANNTMGAITPHATFVVRLSPLPCLEAQWKRSPTRASSLHERKGVGMPPRLCSRRQNVLVIEMHSNLRPCRGGIRTTAPERLNSNVISMPHQLTSHLLAMQLGGISSPLLLYSPECQPCHHTSCF
jgi:hypothetical protein